MADEKPPNRQVTYLGHASLLVEMDGMRLLTDPVFRQRIYHLRRTSPSPDAAPYRDVDAMLISHLHYDHLDIPTLKALGDAPADLRPQRRWRPAERQGIRHYRSQPWARPSTSGGSKCRLSPPTIPPAAAPWACKPTAWASCLRGSAGIYFPGDTQIFPEMADFSQNLDLALLPVWGWGPDKGKLHMGPKEAAEALTLLHPRLAVPIHWGTYIPLGMRWMRLGFQYLPPLEFTERARRASPEVDVRILSPGETLAIHPQQD